MEITKVRVHRRYPIRLEIEVRRPGATEFVHEVITDVSRGGVFLEGGNGLTAGETVTLRLPADDGPIEVDCEVRHVMDAELSKVLAHAPGAGLMFIGLHMIKAEAIQVYVDSVHRMLGFDDVARSGIGGGESEAPPNSQDESVAAVAGRAVSSWLQGKDVYTMLDLPPESRQNEIKNKIMQLQKIVESPTASLRLPGQIKLDEARDAIRRVARLMLNPVSRLQYDFRCGHVRAAQRIEAASRNEGPSVSMMRKVWLETYPEYADEAEQYAAAAYKCAADADYDRAVRRAKVAIEADPFNSELRDDFWDWSEKRSKSTD